MAFELRVDCPSCRVESARVETWDSDSACCRLGIPESARCQMCGASGEGRVADLESVAPGDGCPGCGASIEDDMRDAHRCGFCGTGAHFEPTVGPRSLASHREVEDALQAWARAEALEGTSELLEAYFSVGTSAEIFLALEAGERIETTFDVADYLFSSGGAAGSTDEPAVMREAEEAPPSTQRNIPRGSLPPLPFTSRDELLALASVAAADGEASPEDLSVLLRAAEKRQVQRLLPDEIRVYRPGEITPPPTLVDRERLMEEMLQMAWADGQMDESELRVIKGFARTWGVDPERIKEQIELYAINDSGRIERWFRRVGFFLFPAR